MVNYIRGQLVPNPNLLLESAKNPLACLSLIKEIKENAEEQEDFNLLYSIIEQNYSRIKKAQIIRKAGVFGYLIKFIPENIIVRPAGFDKMLEEML